MKTKIQKEIVPIDETSCCGTLAYGYSNKKAAIKAIEAITGESVDVSQVQKLRVMKIDRDGEPYYFWGDKCNHCGFKNNGVLSYAIID